MSENMHEKMVMTGAVVTSLGVSCLSGVQTAAKLPIPHPLAKVAALGIGCGIGMLSSVASAALLARNATPAELEFPTHAIALKDTSGNNLNITK